MAEPTPPRKGKGGGNVLTRKYGPLPGYAWAGITAGIVYLYIKHRQSTAAASPASTGTSAVDPSIDPTTGVPYSQEVGTGGSSAGYPGSSGGAGSGMDSSWPAGGSGSGVTDAGSPTTGASVGASGSSPAVPARPAVTGQTVITRPTTAAALAAYWGVKADQILLGSNGQPVTGNLTTGTHVYTTSVRSPRPTAASPAPAASHLPYRVYQPRGRVTPPAAHPAGVR